MRLLHASDSGNGEGPAGSEPSPQPRSNSRSDLRQLVPVHGLPADFRSRRSRDAQNRGPKEIRSADFRMMAGTSTQEGAWRKKRIREKYPLTLQRPTEMNSA